MAFVFPPFTILACHLHLSQACNLIWSIAAGGPESAMWDENNSSSIHCKREIIINELGWITRLILCCFGKTTESHLPKVI